MTIRRYAKVKLPKPKSAPEELFALQLRVEGIHHVREYRFHPKRKWRFDFVCYPFDKFVAVEIQGFGRHQRFIGYQNDCERQAEALMLGWRVLQVTPAQVKSGQALKWLITLLAR